MPPALGCSSRLPYDATKDFAMVSTVGLFDFVVIAKGDGPYKTPGDAVAAGRREPEHFNIGTISSGSVQNLTSLLFTSKAGLKVPTIAFKTTGDVVLALMSGASADRIRDFARRGRPD